MFDDLACVHHRHLVAHPCDDAEVVSDENDGHAGFVLNVLQQIEVLRLVALGIVIGLAASFGLARLISSQLWGVSAHDPVTLVIVPALLLVIGVLACWIPARRATRVSPVIALRYE